MIRKFLFLAVLAAFCAPAQAATSKPWRDTVTAFATEHFIHPAWGLFHSQRDYRLAREMAAADHVTLDDDVLFAAAYLHDMGAFAPWAEHKEHGDVSAEKIDLVLGDTDFPKDKLDAVRAACRTHMYNYTPVEPEARYLHDADALDWLGAIGVVRLFYLVDPKAAVKGIRHNEDVARKGVITPAGKARLPGLVAEENAFLDALARETLDFSEL
jgi:uncharacterized protein